MVNRGLQAVLNEEPVMGFMSGFYSMYAMELLLYLVGFSLGIFIKTNLN